jgi:hypothetical protein
MQICNEFWNVNFDELTDDEFDILIEHTFECNLHARILREYERTGEMIAQAAFKYEEEIDFRNIPAAFDYFSAFSEEPAVESAGASGAMPAVAKIAYKLSASSINGRPLRNLIPKDDLHILAKVNRNLLKESGWVITYLVLIALISSVFILQKQQNSLVVKTSELSESTAGNSNDSKNDNLLSRADSITVKIYGEKLEQIESASTDSIRTMFLGNTNSINSNAALSEQNPEAEKEAAANSSSNENNIEKKNDLSPDIFRRPDPRKMKKNAVANKAVQLGELVKFTVFITNPGESSLENTKFILSFGNSNSQICSFTPNKDRACIFNVEPQSKYEIEIQNPNFKTEKIIIPDVVASDFSKEFNLRKLPNETK